MTTRDRRRLIIATSIIGIGLSGFFDGILLHQVLQWHHLLSLVPGDRFRDIGTQILADGLFHILMYLVTAGGLWLLWRSRAALAEPGSGWRSVAGGGLLGFGVWNLIDVGFFHWILGIHRIRIGVPNPMTYDLAWLVVLGLLPMAIAWLILRGGGRADGRHGTSAAVTMSLLTLVAAPMAALPQPGARSALVLFAPGSPPAKPYNVAAAADARIIWADPYGRMMAVAIERPGMAADLYRAGALWVTRSPAVAGCAAALRT